MPSSTSTTTRNTLTGDDREIYNAVMLLHMQYWGNFKGYFMAIQGVFEKCEPSITCADAYWPELYSVLQRDRAVQKDNGADARNDDMWALAEYLIVTYRSDSMASELFLILTADDPADREYARQLLAMANLPADLIHSAPR